MKTEKNTLFTIIILAALIGFGISVLSLTGCGWLDIDNDNDKTSYTLTFNINGGTLNGTTWSRLGDLAASHNTIRVVNGVVQ